MKASRDEKLSRIGCALGLVLLVNGCSLFQPKYRNYRVELRTDAVLAPIAMQVDVIGVRQTEHDVVKGLPLNQYWPESQKRKDLAPLTFQFGAESTNQVIESSNEKYRNWIKAGAVELAIIRDYPSELQKTGDEDFRRFFIDLSSKAHKGKVVKVVIQETGFKIETPETPSKTK